MEMYLHVRGSRSFESIVGMCQLCRLRIKGIQAFFNTFVFDQSAGNPGVIHRPYISGICI